jgi:hypothetical protein
MEIVAEGKLAMEMTFVDKRHPRTKHIEEILNDAAAKRNTECQQECQQQFAVSMPSATMILESVV